MLHILAGSVYTPFRIFQDSSVPKKWLGVLTLFCPLKCVLETFFYCIQENT